MKGTSKLIMGATLVMVVSLAVVLGLILVLLAELYCSLLLRRRRQLRNTISNSNTTIPIQTPTTTVAGGPPPQASFPQEQSPLFSSIYAQGVLQAPRSFLFPEAATKEDTAEQKKQLSELHQVIQIQTQESNSNVIPRQIGLPSAASSPPPPPPPPPPPSFISKTLSKPIGQVDPLQDIASAATICPDKSSGAGEHLVYISNPIYENGESNPNTPFETPDTSPSRLEKSCSSGEDDAEAQGSPSSSTPPYTPPLTPMKKLPAEACSVSLRDARSLGTSGSDSNGLSSSSSASPCTSPSW